MKAIKFIHGYIRLEDGEEYIYDYSSSSPVFDPEEIENFGNGTYHPHEASEVDYEGSINVEFKDGTHASYDNMRDIRQFFTNYFKSLE